MAAPGRKPTPTAIKELEGNPGKRPLNKKEPKPDKKAPTCPNWLDKEARAEWRRLARKMEQLGILTEVDKQAFASYCQAYSRWKNAEEKITNYGTLMKTATGNYVEAPYVGIALKFQRQMIKCAEQFGLTPASR